MARFDDLLTGLSGESEPSVRANRFEDLVPSPRRVVTPRRRSPFREPEREVVDEDATARRAAVDRLSGAPRPVASSVAPSRVPAMAPRDVTATEADRTVPGLKQSLRNQNPTVGDYLAKMTLGQAVEHPVETAAWIAAPLLGPEITIPLGFAGKAIRPITALEAGYAGRAGARVGMYATKLANRALGNEDFAPSEAFDVSGPEAAMEGAFGLILGKGAARGVRAGERTAAESAAGFEDALRTAEQRSAPYRWAKQQNVAETRPSRLLPERSSASPTLSTAEEVTGPAIPMGPAGYMSRDVAETRPDRLLPSRTEGPVIPLPERSPSTMAEADRQVTADIAAAEEEFARQHLRQVERESGARVNEFDRTLTAAAADAHRNQLREGATRIRTAAETEAAEAEATAGMTTQQRMAREALMRRRAGAAAPAVVSALGGAAVGAAGGGMVGDTPEERRRNALAGAAAGGLGAWAVGRRMEGKGPGGPARPRRGAVGDLQREGPWTSAHQLEMGKVRAAETVPGEAPDLLPAMERERPPKARTGAVGDVAKVGGSGTALGQNRASVDVDARLAELKKRMAAGEEPRAVVRRPESDIDLGDMTPDEWWDAQPVGERIAVLERNGIRKGLIGGAGVLAKADARDIPSSHIMRRIIDAEHANWQKEVRALPDGGMLLANRAGTLAPEVAGGVGGAGIGAFAGSTQGDTPEARRRNAVAGALAGATGGAAAFLRGPKMALRRGATAVGVGATGAVLSQSDDEKIKATGVGLMGLATVHAIGLPRLKAAGKAAGGVAVEALKTSETGRKVLDLISHDILADPQVKSLIGAYQEGVAFGKARAAELSKESAALGPSADRKVSDIIEGEAFEPTPLGTDQTIALAVAQRVSDEFTALGKAKVGAGLLAPETVAKREGKYLPRMYAGPLAEVATGEPPRAVVGGRKPRIVGDKMRDESLTPAVRTQLGEVREASFRTAVGLEKGYKDVAAAKLFEGLSEIPGVIHPDYKAAVDGWFTARQMVGEDAVWRTAVRDARKEMDALSKQFKDGTDGYVKLPDTPGLGVLRGAVVRKDVADYLNGIPGVSGPAGKAMSLLKTWKRIHTVLNPGTHVGNTVSNSVIAHMSGVPIWQQGSAIRAALKDYNGYGESTRYLAEKGILDRGLPTAGDAVPSAGQQLRPALEELARTTRPATSRVLKEGGVEPLSPVRRGLRKANVGMERTYSKEDGVFRVMVFDRLVKGGMEKEAAAKYVDEAFVNYETRSPLLGAIKNTVSPFIMYPVKAIPFVAGQIVEHPLRWMTLSAAWGAMDQYAQNKVGEMAQADLRPSQRTNKYLGYLEPGTTQLPMVNQRGDKYMTDIGRWTPFSALTGAPMPGSITSHLSDRLPGIVQPTGPLVEVGARAFNTDPFTGDKWMKPGDDARDKAGKVIGAAANMALPSALSFHLPRVASDIQNADPKAAAVDALGLIGARPSVVRPGMQGTREARKFEQARGNILADLRYALRANKDPKREATLKARAQRKIEALAQQYREGQGEVTP